MDVREAKQSDLNELVSLFEELNEEHHEVLPERFRKAKRENIEWMLFSIFGNSNAKIFVVEEENIVGFAHTTVEEVRENPLFEKRKYVWIHHLIIKNDARNRGAGKALVEKITGWANYVGATTIELTVWEFNGSALQFYENLGFRTLNRHLIRHLDR